MLVWVIAVIVSLIYSLLVPLWLIWPLAVITTLYLLTRQHKKGVSQLSDNEIFWTFLGVLAVLFCQVYLFLGV